MNGKVFQIVPSSMVSIWVFAILVLFLIAMLVMFARFAYWSKSTSFTVTGDSLVINGGPYGTEIPLSQLDLSAMQIVDLKSAPQDRLKNRSNGIAMPGYRSGWFSSKSGEKSLVFLTDLEKVLLIPTRDDFVLLLSVKSADEFVEVLKQKG